MRQENSEVNTQLQCFGGGAVQIANYSKWARQVLDKLQIYQAMNIIHAYDELSTSAYFTGKMGI